MTKDEIIKFMINNSKYDYAKEYIEIKSKNKSTIKEMYLIVNKELLLPIKDKNNFIYKGKAARLIIWWLYLKDIITDEEFLKYIGASKIEDNIIPNVRADESLKWCHIIQKQLKMKTTPVFHNKGKTKYYMLHINKNQ